MLYSNLPWTGKECRQIAKGYRNANCKLQIATEQMLDRIQILWTIYSRSLAQMGVTEKPRMSSGEEAQEVLGIGIRLAVL